MIGAGFLYIVRIRSYGNSYKEYMVNLLEKIRDEEESDEGDDNKKEENITE